MRWIWGRVTFGLKYVASLVAVMLLMALLTVALGAAIVGVASVIEWLGGF